MVGIWEVGFLFYSQQGANYYIIFTSNVVAPWHLFCTAVKKN